MKIAIITPAYPPSIGGNATTASRIAEGLNSRKIKTKVFLPDELKNPDSIGKLADFKPDVIHAFHARKSGIIASRISEKFGIPLMITATGTDVNLELNQKMKRKMIIKILDKAVFITAFHKSIKSRIAEKIPRLAKKIRIIKQTVKLMHRNCDIRKKLGLKKEDFVFFLPAGLRKIKYGYFYIDKFEELNKNYGIKLVIAGPASDKKFAEHILEKIKAYSWIFYIDKISHDRIKCVFEGIDASLNTSTSEGGMSNAVLEAMSAGKPVLASDIEGNSSIVKNNFNGLLFKNKNDFYRKAEKLVMDKNSRKVLGNNGEKMIKKHFHFEEEIGNYIKLYKLALSKTN